MRIALGAMCGVRAYNPELTALGLSLPGFVERGRTVASLPSLGLLTLAALTDDRFDVDYYEVDDIADAPGPAAGKLAKLAADLKAAELPVKRLDLGGGLGIAYDGEQPPEPGQSAALVAESPGRAGCCSGRSRSAPRRSRRSRA